MTASKTPKKILVVGGAGYIGSHINKMLHSNGYQTLILDNLSRGDKSLVKQGTFIHGNMGDQKLLNHLFSTESIEAVLHFASYIDVGESVSQPALYYQNNVGNTITLLNEMVKHKIRALIFSSTAAVYGQPQKVGSFGP